MVDAREVELDCGARPHVAVDHDMAQFGRRFAGQNSVASCQSVLGNSDRAAVLRWEMDSRKNSRVAEPERLASF
jgi:hypothetical protein